MKRGEIRWYKFRKPDKKRPVLILTRDAHIDYLHHVTIAAVTGTVRDIPSQVILTKRDGMEKECAISADHIRTVDKGKIGKLITSLSNEKMQELKKAILYALGY